MGVNMELPDLHRSIRRTPQKISKAELETLAADTSFTAPDSYTDAFGDSVLCFDRAGRGRSGQ